LAGLRFCACFPQLVRAAGFICEKVAWYWRNRLLCAMAVIIARFPVVMTPLGVQPATMRECLRRSQQANSHDHAPKMHVLSCISF
jgi:hypothetical protein